MVFQPLTQQYLSQVGALLHHYYSLEGKHYSPALLKRLIQSSPTDKPFILVHGKRVLGYVTLRFLDTNAEIHHFITLHTSKQSTFVHTLLHEALDYCEKHGITTISAVIPTLYNDLFASFGFSSHTPMISMIKERVHDRQTSLSQTLSNIDIQSYIQDISQKTSARLRKLRTKK